jgi:phosphoenolpyruvate-protein phosphotransferase
MRTLVGTGASAGVARGPLVIVRREPVIAGGRIDVGDAPAEIVRLSGAMDASADELESLARSMERKHPDEAGIFDAHALFARDEELLSLASSRIRTGEDAIAAVRGAMAQFVAILLASGDELLAARAADLDDVVTRIVGHLTGIRISAPSILVPSIVMAADLPPSVTASISHDRLLGIVLSEGSRTAHAAILARAYGIPAVVGVAGLLAILDADHPAEVLLDGSTGEVVLDPDESTAARFDQARMAAAAADARALDEATLPAVTRNGIEVTLLANVGGSGEAARAVALGATGVGLFRTEFLFVERPVPPTENEQVAAYRAVVDAFAPHPVTIRLLDVGGDKPIPYLPIEPEANPFLGVRALRLAWTQPELFVTQLRASYRAAAGTAPGTVKVMAPMIADARDTDLLLKLAETARTGLDAAGVARGEVELGVMLEIPAAIVAADTYLALLRFGSLGTNDLLQYTVAVDRGNRVLGRYQESLHPALLRLIAMAVEASARAGTELSVCGEMAGDPAAALALVALGVRKLSMASSSLAGVRRAIRGADAVRLDAARTLARDGRTADEIRAGMMALLR